MRCVTEENIDTFSEVPDPLLYLDMTALSAMKKLQNTIQTVTGGRSGMMCAHMTCGIPRTRAFARRRNPRSRSNISVGSGLIYATAVPMVVTAYRAG